MKIGKYDYPEDLLYDGEHNWVRVEGQRATQGLTDLGQALAGEIVYAEVPRVGRTVEKGQQFMSLESGKWVGRVKALVSGVIVEANEEIDWESTVINESPYEKGWFAVFEMGNPAELQGLYRASDAEYQALVLAEAAKYGK
ncbi:MAG: glycine cleavage system protein H [Chloroflexi bacterium]|nr:glycine cleavage system protein H [Chloroflexota bacterium]